MWALLWVSATVLMQPRGAEVASKALELRLAQPARFAEVTVPAGRYVVSLTDQGLVLTSPASMVQVALLKVVESTAKAAVSEPSVTVREHGRDVDIVLKTQDRVLTIKGTRAEAAAATQVALSDKPERPLAEALAPPSEVALVDGALQRYVVEVVPCADKAQRGRWTTDDARFQKCVCPIAERWRLPKVKGPLRLHRPLARGKSGYSLTVTPEGKAQDCRVWVGPRSPEETPPASSP